MKKNEIKVKVAIGVIYTLAFVLIALLELAFNYCANYTYPDTWIVPSVFRGMSSSEAIMYCLAQYWWWIMHGGAFILGLIFITNKIYLLISYHRELEK
jgi:hypothetical protein